MDFACYALLATLVLTGLERLERRVQMEALLHVTFAVAGLLLSKANVAYPAILLSLWVLHRSGVRRSFLLAVFVMALALATAVLIPIKVTLLSVSLAYMGLAGRLLPTGLLMGVVTNVNSGLALADFAAYVALYQRLCSWPLLPGSGERPSGAILSPCWDGVLLRFRCSPWERTATSSCRMRPLPCSGSRSWLSQSASAVARSRAAFAIAVTVGASLIAGRTRLANQTAGGWYRQGCFQTTIGDSFFGRTKSCEALPLALREVDQVLSSHRGSRIFFGPRLEFVYADRRLPSPLHLPNWWDPGTSYPLSKADSVANNWEEDHFDLLILTADANDLKQLPPRIAQEIDRDYIRTADTSLIHVYERRKM